MPNRESDDQLLCAALGRTNDCPPVEDLERLLLEVAPETLKDHVDGCPHCRTELEMLRSFTSDRIAEADKTAVNAIAERLKARTTISAPKQTAAVESRSWWKRVFEARWLSLAAATIAIALVAVGVSIEFRQGKQPALDAATGSAEVLRSGSITMLSPIGDIRAKPVEIRWEAVPNAVRYGVHIVEVDHTQLWGADSTAPRIDLPPEARALVIPSKTLLIQVSAFDASGQKIAESETTRFRLLQNVYTH